MLLVPFYLSVCEKDTGLGADKPVIGRFFSFCLEKGEKGGKKLQAKAGRGLFVALFIIRGHSASFNRCLDGNSGSQSSGYGFQVQCGGCYVRCTLAGIIMEPQVDFLARFGALIG